MCLCARPFGENSTFSSSSQPVGTSLHTLLLVLYSCLKGFFLPPPFRTPVSSVPSIHERRQSGTFDVCATGADLPVRFLKSSERLQPGAEESPSTGSGSPAGSSAAGAAVCRAGLNCCRSCAPVLWPLTCCATTQEPRACWVHICRAHAGWLWGPFVASNKHVA